jgi:hypothetical protein
MKTDEETGMIEQISSASFRCDTKSTVEVFKSKIAIRPCKISLPAIHCTQEKKLESVLTTGTFRLERIQTVATCGGFGETRGGESWQTARKDGPFCFKAS